MNTKVNRLLCIGVLSLLASVALGACSDGAGGGSTSTTATGSATQTPKPALPSTTATVTAPVPVATLKELMDSTVDPAADGIWDAVAITSTTKGTEIHQPRTPEEWAAVRRHAVTLIEAMNLVVLPGRHAAPPGTHAGLGELEPAAIERGIEQRRELFVSFAKTLQGTAQLALEAIDKKDTDAVVKTGGDIDAACEVCHVTFWYPNQP